MNTATSDFRVLEFRHVLNTDDKAMAGIEVEMANLLKRFENDREGYVKLIASEDERRQYNEFAAEWKQYLQVHEKVLALSRKNDNAQAVLLLQGESARVFDSFTAKLEKLI